MLLENKEKSILLSFLGKALLIMKYFDELVIQPETPGYEKCYQKCRILDHWSKDICIICQKLKGRVFKQKEASPDPLATDPLFTYVSLDIFGPWMAASHSTWYGFAKKKKKMGTHFYLFEYSSSPLWID